MLQFYALLYIGKRTKNKIYIGNVSEIVILYTIFYYVRVYHTNLIEGFFVVFLSF